MIMHPKDIFAIIAALAILLLVGGAYLQVEEHSAYLTAYTYGGLLAVVATLWRIWFHAEITE